MIWYTVSFTFRHEVSNEQMFEKSNESEVVDNVIPVEIIDHGLAFSVHIGPIGLAFILLIIVIGVSIKLFFYFNKNRYNYTSYQNDNTSTKTESTLP